MCFSGNDMITELTEEHSIIIFIGSAMYPDSSVGSDLNFFKMVLNPASRSYRPYHTKEPVTIILPAHTCYWYINHINKEAVFPINLVAIPVAVLSKKKLKQHK